MVQASLAEQWQDIYVSPVGVVEKDGTDVRIINDYSFPEGASINDFTDRANFPVIKYNPPGDIARRILTLRRDYPSAHILMMLGDVSGAFRHVPIHADHVHMFTFVIGEYLVVDLACGFGWCGSPAWYFVPGMLINRLYEETSVSMAASSRPLTGLFWCDDHTCVEVEDGLRCFEANIALRRAMATVLGPAAINTRKFTDWKPARAGTWPPWDTQAGTVTIPPDKMKKAKGRVDALIVSGASTKTGLLQLLGSLRHIYSCCPPARAFYQRIQSVASGAQRYARITLCQQTLEDLKWFRYILQHHDRFNGIPVSQFSGQATAMVHVHMDTSDEGLCVLEPQLRQYVRVRLTAATKKETVRLTRLMYGNFKVAFLQHSFGARRGRSSFADNRFTYASG